jgi:hypothetical protein
VRDENDLLERVLQPPQQIHDVVPPGSRRASRTPHRGSAGKSLTGAFRDHLRDC